MFEVHYSTNYIQASNIVAPSYLLLTYFFAFVPGAGLITKYHDTLQLFNSMFSYVSFILSLMAALRILKCANNKLAFPVYSVEIYCLYRTYTIASNQISSVFEKEKCANYRNY